MTIRDGFKLEDSTLHWACSFNSVGVAKVLLSFGIDADVTNLEGVTPLHIAVKMVNVGMINLLLSEGASTGSLDHSGKAPIEHLQADNDIVENLLKFPPKPTLTIRNAFVNDQNESCEMRAAEPNISTTSSSLLNREMKPEVTSKSINGNGADAEESSAQKKENRAAAKLSVSLRGLKDSYSYRENEVEASGGNELPLLVLWPPAKRQIQCNTEPFVLKSSETIIIHLSCESADIYPILKQSGLLEILLNFKMKTSVIQPGRGVTNGAAPSIPKIKLCVDADLCPGRHRFEIKVTSDQVSVLASDPQGGLYGLYALTQLFQLHSELNQRLDGVIEFKTARIAITDWPDVMNRAIMWSFRKSAQTTFAALRDIVDLISKIRINVLYLIIDTVDNEVAVQQDDSIQEKGISEDGIIATEEKENVKSSEKKDMTLSDQDSNDAVSSHIAALDEICDAACVELVPTVTISSIKQRLSSTLLRKFNHTMVCIIFAFDRASVQDELEADGVDVKDAQCNTACRAVCESVLEMAAVIGFSAVTFSCSTWTHQVADPEVRPTQQCFLFILAYSLWDAYIN